MKDFSLGKPLLFCDVPPAVIPPETGVISFREPALNSDPSVATLEGWFVKAQGRQNFFESSKRFFLDWAVKGRFLDCATWNGKALLGPLRWGFFLQLKARVQKIEMLTHILETLLPSQVTVKGLGEEDLELTRFLCQKRNIEVLVIPSAARASLIERLRSPGAFYRFLVQRYNRFFVQNLLYRASLILYAGVGLVKFLLLRWFSRPELIFFSANSNWLKVVGPDGNRSQEVLLETFLEAARNAKQSFWILTLMDGPELALKSLFMQPVRTIPFEGVKLYYRLFRRAELEGLNQRAMISFDHWKDLSLFTYRGFDFRRHVEKSIVNHGTKLGVKWAEEASLMRLFAEEVQGSRWILTSEMSNWVPAVMAAQDAGIETLGVSHAVIYPYRMEYIYSPKEDHSRIPRCSRFAVWGSYEKECISGEEGFYSAKDVLVIGSPKKMNRLGREAARDLVLNPMHLDPKLPLALCTSNNRHHAFARKLMESWKEVPGWNLIVKLHPRELNEHQYSYWAKYYGIQNIRVVRDYDFLALAQACDVHLSFSSTTIIEAAYLERPTILFDDGLKQDPLAVVQMGVAHFLSDFPSMRKAIEFISRPEQREKFQNAQREFVHKRFHPQQSISEVVYSLSSLSNEQTDFV